MGIADSNFICIPSECLSVNPFKKLAERRRVHINNFGRLTGTNGFMKIIENKFIYHVHTHVFRSVKRVYKYFAG